MAINAQVLNGWDDVAAFLSTMKDTRGNNYFSNVVYDSTANTLSLYTTESGANPFAVFDTSSIRFNAHYDNAGADASYSIQYLNSSSVNFPINGYKARHGCILALKNVTSATDLSYAFPIAFCKTHEGYTALLHSAGQPLSANSARNAYIHTYTSDYYARISQTGAALGFKIDPPSSNLTMIVPNADFTTMIELPVFTSQAPDYTENAYFLLTRQSYGVFGSFTYSGHVYLTNGRVAILDT